MFFHIPQNKILSKYIRYIQIFEPDGQKKEYLIFPNCGSAITFYKDIDFIEESWSIFSEQPYPENKDVVLHINRVDPVRIKDSGRSTRFSIVFHTLGINHFIRDSLQELAIQYNPTAVRIWQREPGYKLFSEKIFGLITRNERLLAIENFFADQLNSFENYNLEQVIPELEDVYNNNSIEKIAADACVTVKTLERLFKKHICLNPVQYRNIARFRNSLKHKLNSPETSLTNMAAESNYCDLPYMMKTYQKYTGQSVNNFFENLKLDVDGNYVYQVI